MELLTETERVKALYEIVQGDDGKCCFCLKAASHTFYAPLLRSVKVKGPYGSMKAYRVCATHVSKCNNVLKEA